MDKCNKLGFRCDSDRKITLEDEEILKGMISHQKSNPLKKMFKWYLSIIIDIHDHWAWLEGFRYWNRTNPITSRCSLPKKHPFPSKAGLRKSELASSMHFPRILVWSCTKDLYQMDCLRPHQRAFSCYQCFFFCDLAPSPPKSLCFAAPFRHACGRTSTAPRTMKCRRREQWTLKLCESQFPEFHWQSLWFPWFKSSPFEWQQPEWWAEDRRGREWSTSYCKILHSCWSKDSDGPYLAHTACT